jgi:hypothetical protein
MLTVEFAFAAAFALAVPFAFSDDWQPPEAKAEAATNAAAKRPLRPIPRRMTKSSLKQSRFQETRF